MAAALAFGGDILLTPGMEPITASVKVRSRTYTLADGNGKGAIQIGADGVTIDFQGATLQSPDEPGGRKENFNGVGLMIADHRNVTIRNAHIHGFHVNVEVLRSSGIKLENCEVSDSRSQRMMIGDSPTNVWLDLRGLDSWRSYGAGAWIEKCSKCVVEAVKANQSQNGLILVNANDNKIVGCDFSYNSGWGIALCGSSDNLISWNHADFCNRPWAGGWGGDSSGVVLTSGSNRNVWANNSFTHGGDGFFLATKNGGWDDKGKLHEEGTCDENLVAYNDGSWSTANAFESTFSVKNVFYRNFADESNYGFWLGYSNQNIVQGNEIIGSHVDAIAHEQGSKNLYLDNDIENTGGTAIHLWSGREVRFDQSPSEGNVISGNKIVKAGRAYDLTNSTGYTAEGNVVREAPIPAGFHPLSAGGGRNRALLTPGTLAEVRKLKPAGFTMYRDTDLPKGWQWLAPSAYGMRDYRKMPVPWMMKDDRTVRLYIPSGEDMRGARRTRRPEADATRKADVALDLPPWMVESKAENPGEMYLTAKPSKEPYGQYRDFRFKATVGKQVQWIAGHLLDLMWHVRWFKWFRNDHDAYTDSAGWASLFAGPALREEDLPALPQIPGYAAPEPGLPGDHFALDATSKIKLAAGRYRFDTISDDGIQVLVDGKLVVNNWTHHGGTADTGEIELAAGVHEIEIHYCQEDGGAALSVHWTAVASASSR